MIFLGADHEGVEMKSFIAEKLKSEHVVFEDFGTFSSEPVDYPNIAKQVAKAVKQQGGQGVLFCKSGEGMAIAANRIRGIRCAEVWNVAVAVEARQDNDANMIALASGYLDDETAWQITRAFLSTTFGHEERHERRIKQIDEE